MGAVDSAAKIAADSRLLPLHGGSWVGPVLTVLALGRNSPVECL